MAHEHYPTFIKQIYTKVPELLNVRIDAISLKRDGTEVSVVFDMPVYPDNSKFLIYISVSMYALILWITAASATKEQIGI